MTQLEICAGSLDSVWAAKIGGADRVELCVGLGEGGLTPSVGLLHAAMQVEGIRKNILIRPRGGDFLYTDAETDMMADDIAAAREAGADGVVIGALTSEGDIDLVAMRRMMAAANDMSVTFHRAFDVLRNPQHALEQLVGLGVDRILTSGQAASAETGIGMLRRLCSQAAGRISIMPGCGVSPANARSIVTETGVHEIHASARAAFRSGMAYRNEAVKMGNPNADEYLRMETSAEIVREIVREIRNP